MRKINPILLGCAGLVICAGFYFIFFPMISAQLSGQKPVTLFGTYDAPSGKLYLATTISDMSQEMIVYRVTPADNDMIEYWNGDPVYIGNVTSEAEAPQVAQKILEKYGGLPDGARLSRVETEYIEKIQSSEIPFVPPSVVERIPESTVLNYGRHLGDYIVVNGYIRIELGRNGELLNLKKVWRTVTPSGTMRVIPATEALKKIQRGDVLNDRLKCICDLTVDKVQLAYLENDYNESQEYLTPIWVFHGTLSSGGSYSYWVSALDSIDDSRFISELHTPSATDMKLDIPKTIIESGNKSH
jgi:hypothetical protein